MEQSWLWPLQKMKESMILAFQPRKCYHLLTLQFITLVKLSLLLGGLAQPGQAQLGLAWRGLAIAWPGLAWLGLAGLWLAGWLAGRLARLVDGLLLERAGLG